MKLLPETHRTNYTLFPETQSTCTKDFNFLPVFQGKSALEALTQMVELENGSRIRLHDKDELERMIERKRELLDMLADDNGLEVVLIERSYGS